LNAWLQRLGWWLKPTLPVLLILGSTLFPFSAGFWSSDPAVWYRRWGLALQLLGFIATWKQLRDVITQHGGTGFLSRFWNWAKAHPFKKRGVNMIVGAGTLGGLTGFARGRSRASKTDDSIEGRLLAVEKNLSLVDAELDQVHKEHDQTKREVTTAIESETEERKRSIQRITDEQREGALESIDLQARGLVWFLAGTVLTTIPDELAKWSCCALSFARGH
jgi:hypothetical protein